MNTITLAAGQVSQILEVGPGTRITTTGSGSVSYYAGALADAKNGATFTTWPLGSTAGYQDVLRRCCIKATATGAMTITLEEYKNDNLGAEVVFDSSIITAVKDANGNTTGLSAGDGVVIPIPAVVNAGTATSTLTLGAGEHTSTALTAGYYRVDPDMDVYVKGSNTSALYGALFGAGTGAFKTASGSLAAQTGLELGAASYSMEFWLQLNADTSADARPFIMGWSGGSMLHVYYAVHPSGYIQCGLQMKTSAGVDFSSGSLQSAIGVLPGSSLKHYVVTVTRAGDGGTGTIKFYINGSQVGQTTYTEATPAASLSASAMTNAGSFIGLGVTISGTNYQWDGRIEDVKVYPGVVLTSNQVIARNNAGPLRTIGLDAADAYLASGWWMNFQGGVATCESGYGNASMSAVGSGCSVTVRDGGIPATITDNKIYGGKPEVVNLTNTYLSVYSDSLSAGSVRLTKVS